MNTIYHDKTKYIVHETQDRAHTCISIMQEQARQILILMYHISLTPHLKVVFDMELVLFIRNNCSINIECLLGSKQTISK